jgi:hypothetical protein
MRLNTIAVMVLGGFLVGCSSAQRVDPVGNERTTVTVDNQSFLDMAIYATRGQRVRLGTAAGHSKTVLVIPEALLGGVGIIRFIADPIGSSRASVSEEISVTKGDDIGLLIPPG